MTQSCAVYMLQKKRARGDVDMDEPKPPTCEFVPPDPRRLDDRYHPCARHEGCCLQLDVLHLFQYRGVEHHANWGYFYPVINGVKTPVLCDAFDPSKTETTQCSRLRLEFSPDQVISAAEAGAIYPVVSDSPFHVTSPLRIWSAPRVSQGLPEDVAQSPCAARALRAPAPPERISRDLSPAPPSAPPSAAPAQSSALDWFCLGWLLGSGKCDCSGCDCSGCDDGSDDGC